MSKYPVGATWEVKNSRGRILIWLERRTEYTEMWRWNFEYPDGSSSFGWESGDWNTSYRKCLEECSHKLLENGKAPRMKRVK